MTPGEEEVLAEIRRVAAFELELDCPVEPDDAIVSDLQLDSVATLTLVVALEDRFRIRLDDVDAARVRTVADLVRLVEARRGTVSAGVTP